MKTIYAEITGALAKADAAILEQSKEWARRKIAALAKYKAETPRTTKDMTTRYYEMFDICGGKVWFEQFQYGERSALEFVEKNAKRNAEKRNFKIAAQLEKAGITSITGGGLIWNANGFDGEFNVETDRGPLRVVVNTIYAGGYNIQCFHLRVLVKIK
jgi:hypothetical protein